MSAKSNVVELDGFKKKGPGRPKLAKTVEKEEKQKQEWEKRQQFVEKEVTKITKRHSRLMKSIKEADSDQKANIKILKYCLNMTVRLLPLAEESYLKYQNDRSVYALKALTEQSREIMDDIRMLSNNDNTMDFLLEQVLVPSLQLLLQHIVNDFSTLKRHISESVPPKKAKVLRSEMNRMMKAQGALLDDMRKGLEVKIEEYFQ